MEHWNGLGVRSLAIIKILGEYKKKGKFEKHKHISCRVFMDIFKGRCAKIFPLETLYEIIDVKGFCNPGVSLPSPESCCSS